MAQAFFTPWNAASSRTWLISTMRASAQALSWSLGGRRPGAGAGSGASGTGGGAGGAKDTTGAGSTRARALLPLVQMTRAARAARVAAGKEAGSYSRPPPPALPGRGREDAPSATSLSRVRRSDVGMPGRPASSRAVSQVIASPRCGASGALVPSELREALARYGGPALSGCVRRRQQCGLPSCLFLAVLRGTLRRTRARTLPRTCRRCRSDVGCSSALAGRSIRAPQARLRTACPWR